RTSCTAWSWRCVPSVVSYFFFFSSRRRHTRLVSDWSSDVCSSDLRVWNLRERTMRELVARYLSQGISRRGFVGGLTKAGLTASAAQSVLSAVASVSPGYAQGAGPQPDAAPAAPAPAPAATRPAPPAV